MSYDEHQAMWPQMIAALAAIDTALGIPDDGCNSTAQTLEKIRRLRAVEDKANSCIVDNARLAEQVERLRAALSEVLEVVSLPREPSWAYRNTITTNRDRIKSACTLVLGPNVGAKRAP